jgi:hypothetical protein
VYTAHVREYTAPSVPPATAAAAVTAKPGFLPPGALATYTEVFDKTGLTEPVWGLRRDMSWGTMSGASDA